MGRDVGYNTAKRRAPTPLRSRLIEMQKWCATFVTPCTHTHTHTDRTRVLYVADCPAVTVVGPDTISIHKLYILSSTMRAQRINTSTPSRAVALPRRPACPTYMSPMAMAMSGS